jgi:hypothetical protein
MKVLLRNTKTNLYFVGINQWTDDPNQARDFGRVEDAIRLDREEQMTDMEVILRCDDPYGDLVLPLRKPR